MPFLMNVPDHHVLREGLLKHLKGKDLLFVSSTCKDFYSKTAEVFWENLFQRVLLMGSRDVTSQSHSKEFSKCGKNVFVNNWKDIR